MSTRMRAATCTSTLSTSAIVKPDFSAVTTYTPGRTLTNSYEPSAPVTLVCEIPVAVLVNVTFASGTTPPDASRTEPTTAAVSNCAAAGATSGPIRMVSRSRILRVTDGITHLRNQTEPSSYERAVTRARNGRKQRDTTCTMRSEPFNRSISPRNDGECRASDVARIVECDEPGRDRSGVDDQRQRRCQYAFLMTSSE